MNVDWSLVLSAAALLVSGVSVANVVWLRRMGRKS